VNWLFIIGWFFLGWGLERYDFRSFDSESVAKVGILRYELFRLFVGRKSFGSPALANELNNSVGLAGEPCD